LYLVSCDLAVLLNPFFLFLLNPGPRSLHSAFRFMRHARCAVPVRHREVALAPCAFNLLTWVFLLFN
jgi:hypothetical protein